MDTLSQFDCAKKSSSTSSQNDSSHNDNASTIVESQIQLNLVPPLNFSLVEDGIYRSGFPMEINYPFLQQLNLRTIIYLGDLGHHDDAAAAATAAGAASAASAASATAATAAANTTSATSSKKTKKKKKDKDGSTDIYNQYVNWINAQKTITFHNLPMESSQEPFINQQENEQSLRSLTTALHLILDNSNYPILIHSNKGKHRTGLFIGLMRKLLQGWCLSGIFEEYEKFAMGKFEYDLELIEIWQPELVVDDARKPNFVRV
ncbi:hypothetical protein KGF57_003951 [Candida theae]|uniref:Uncharacterized protein n=1 Tax=Candida theae TaxID=1198502 RepID=A0AAD5BC70_9ASCO|nr:uncharacterized protein KGF57_003951 [Candida theae]KAI5953742.1 hypothetical protein KGF57_003951 [Candida theae]